MTGKNFQILLVLVLSLCQHPSDAQDFLNKYQKGISYFDNKKYNRAIQSFNEALPDAKASYEAGQNAAPYLSSLCYLGQSLRATGQNDEAFASLHSVIDLSDNGYPVPDSLLIVVLSTISDILVNQGKYTEAEYFTNRLMKAIPVDDIGNPFFSKGLYRLGLINTNLGRLENAKVLYEQCLQTLQKSNSTAEYVLVLSAQARLLIRLNEFDAARTRLQESIDLSRRIQGDTSALLASALNNMADYYISVKDYARADSSLNRSIAIYSHREHSSPLDYLPVLLNLAYVYRFKGEYEKSITTFDQAFSYLKTSQLEYEPYYATWLSRYIVVCIANRRYEKAEELMVLAKNNYINQLGSFFPHLTENEKELFYQDIKWRFEVFNSFAILRYSQNPLITRAMFDNRLVSKAILLNENNKWKKRILASGDVQLIAQFVEWQRKKQLLGKYYQLHAKAYNKNEIQRLEKEVEKLEKDLTNRSELFATPQDNINVSWKDIRKRLNPGEAAIEILRFRKFDFGPNNRFTDTVYYAALIISQATSKSPQLVLLKNGNALEKRYLNNYRNSILKTELDTISYDQFWRPIANAVGNNKRLFISNDGVFNLINLSTIYNRHSGKYVIEENDIRVVTNTKDLLNPSIAEGHNNLAVIIGNPDFGTDLHEGLPLSTRGTRPVLVPLPGTRKECEELNDLLRNAGWERNIFLGKRALEENLKQIYRPRLLHIATHGFFEMNSTTALKQDGQVNPLFQSGLYFAGAQNLDTLSLEKEDGILTAYECMQLNLENTELVTLSACETGLGEVDNGEGVYGLQRAFMVAGARNIVMSLWKVDDETTQELMTAFYTNWFTMKDKHQAFKEAQLTVKRKFPNPYYWGGFIMIGL